MLNFIDFIRMANASQNFSLSNKFEFISFDDISKEHIEETGEVPEALEIWAAVKVPYEGSLPESYKVLNLMIGDWVVENVTKLTPVIHDELNKHVKEHYPDSEIEGLDQLEDTAIWMDQIDYMPVIDEDGKTLKIEIELVLTAEAI